MDATILAPVKFISIIETQLQKHTHYECEVLESPECNTYQFIEVNAENKQTAIDIKSFLRTVEEIHLADLDITANG